MAQVPETSGPRCYPVHTDRHRPQNTNTRTLEPAGQTVKRLYNVQENYVVILVCWKNILSSRIKSVENLMEIFEISYN